MNGLARPDARERRQSRAGFLVPLRAASSLSVLAEGSLELQALGHSEEVVEGDDCQDDRGDADQQPPTGLHRFADWGAPVFAGSDGVIIQSHGILSADGSQAGRVTPAGMIVGRLVERRDRLTLHDSTAGFAGCAKIGIPFDEPCDFTPRVVSL